MKRTVNSERYAKLKRQGLVRRSDFKGDLNSTANRSKLYRLDRLYNDPPNKGGRIRKYLNSEKYQRIRTNDPAIRRAIQPKELRRLKIPFVFVRTDTRVVEGTRVAPNKIKSIRKTKDGVKVKTEATDLTFLDLKLLDFEKNPQKLAKLQKKYGGLIATRVGFSTFRQLYLPNQVLELRDRLGRYAKREEFVEGFILVDDPELERFFGDPPEDEEDEF